MKRNKERNKKCKVELCIIFCVLKYFFLFNYL